MTAIRIKYFLPIIIVSLLTGCRQKNEPRLPSHQDRFVQVYVELLKLRESLPLKHPALLDSSRVILEKHHFTKEEYDHSLAYFNEKPERWEAFYREVLKRLKEENPSSPSSQEPPKNRLHQR